MTSAETEILSAMVGIWNKYIELPQENIHDLDEFRHHFHILQRMILCREARRNFNGKPARGD